MGMSHTMSWSLAVAMNFVGKLHIASIESLEEGVHLHPMNDGLFLTSEKASPLRETLRTTFARLARLFYTTEHMHFRFLPRGAIAYGVVARGVDLAKSQAPTLHSQIAHRQSILLGRPVVEAFRSEKDAPPFGMLLTDSVSKWFNRKPIGDGRVAWPWIEKTTLQWDRFVPELFDYFDWTAKRRADSYPAKSRRRHAEACIRYFDADPASVDIV